MIKKQSLLLFVFCGTEIIFTMKLAIATIVILTALVSHSDGIEIFNRNRFSVVALPFKYYGITPKYIDEAPRELLQVCATIPMIEIFRWQHIPTSISIAGEMAKCRVSPR